jgi:hypothetical protein
LLLELVDPLRRFDLAEVVVHLLARLLGEGVEVRALRARHRLVAGSPALRGLEGVPRLLLRALLRLAVRHQFLS